MDYSTTVPNLLLGKVRNIRSLDLEDKKVGYLQKVRRQHLVLAWASQRLALHLALAWASQYLVQARASPHLVLAWASQHLVRARASSRLVLPRAPPHLVLGRASQPLVLFFVVLR